MTRIKEEAPDEVAQQSSVQCSFNPSSYKMLYVCDGEDYLYRSRALPRAQEVGTTITLKSCKFGPIESKFV